MIGTEPSLVRLSRRSFLKIAGAAVGAAVLAACAPAPTATPAPPTAAPQKAAPTTAPTVAPAAAAKKLKGTVVVAVNGWPAPANQAAVDALTKAYKERQPDVELKWEGSTGPGFSYPQWLGTMLAANPVVVDLVAGNYQASYRNYVDLSKYRKTINPYTKRAWEEDYDWKTFTGRDSATKTTILSTWVVHCYWFYNKAMFADAGVQPPATWADWIDVCTKLKAKGYTPISTNFSYQVPQWNCEVYYDQFFRQERYDLGKALEGDWSYDPDVDGKMKFNPKEKDFDKSFTLNAARWIKAVKDGKFSYGNDKIGILVKRMGEIFNTDFCTKDLFVLSDQYLPFLQKQTAIMNNGTWSLPTLALDMTSLTDARREALKISKDTKIEPFEWGTFENPSMTDPEVQGTARAVESSAGPYCGLVQKDQAQTDMAMDFMMFWYSPVGQQIACDALIAGKTFTPSGPPFVKDLKLPEEYTKMFTQVKFLGNAEIGWNSFVRLGKGGGQLYQGSETLFADCLQKKVTPPDFAKQLGKMVVDNFSEILAGANLTDADIANPERKPATA